MPALALRAACGAQVEAALYQSAVGAWHFELLLHHDGVWRYVDSAPLDAIEPGGMWLDEDGSLSLSLTELDDETWEERVLKSFRLPPAEIVRLRAHAESRLAFRPPRRPRLSPLAARSLPLACA